jgi:hypothetical protein
MIPRWGGTAASPSDPLDERRPSAKVRGLIEYLAATFAYPAA